MKRHFAVLVSLLVLFVARAQGHYSTGQQLPMIHMSGLLNLTETIPLPGDGYMDHLTVDPKGQRLFISGEAAKSVIAVDLRAGKVIMPTKPAVSVSFFPRSLTRELTPDFTLSYANVSP